MTSRSDWRRVSSATPCPICGRPDWCLLTGARGGTHGGGISPYRILRALRGGRSASPAQERCRKIPALSCANLPLRNRGRASGGSGAAGGTVPGST